MLKRELALSKSKFLLLIFFSLAFLPFWFAWNIYYVNRFFWWEGSAIGQLIFLLLFIAVHELLHAVGFVYAGKARWKDIRFGIYHIIAAYCNCRVPVSLRAAIISVVLPSVCTALLAVVGELVYHHYLWSWIMVLTLTGGVGDFYCLWVLRKYCKLDGEYYFQDTPLEKGQKKFVFGYIIDREEMIAHHPADCERLGISGP